MPVKDLDLWVTIPTDIPMDQPTSTHRFMILMPTLNSRQHTHTQMLLATLFDFNRLDSGLDLYCGAVGKNLDAEADV